MLQNVFNVSICFHSEAPSKNPTRKVAHSLHYPVGVAVVTVSHFSLVSYLPCVGRGSKLCNEVQDTAPKFPAPGGCRGGGWGAAPNLGGGGLPTRLSDSFGRALWRNRYLIRPQVVKHHNPITQLCQGCYQNILQ